jgi:hypothetical protein
MILMLRWEVFAAFKINVSHKQELVQIKWHLVNRQLFPGQDFEGVPPSGGIAGEF